MAALTRPGHLVVSALRYTSGARDGLQEVRAIVSCRRYMSSNRSYNTIIIGIYMFVCSRLGLDVPAVGTLEGQVTERQRLDKMLALTHTQSISEPYGCCS